MTYSLDDLRSSFALLDYRGAHGRGVTDTIAELGLDIQDVTHVAEQRGMRAALHATDDTEGLAKINAAQATGEFLPIRLTPEQQRIMAICAAAELDAIAATLLMVTKADA